MGKISLNLDTFFSFSLLPFIVFSLSLKSLVFIEEILIELLIKLLLISETNLFLLKKSLSLLILSLKNELLVFELFFSKLLFFFQFLPLID